MTMRQRSTWAKPGETPRQAATQRQADIYTMNQEHQQPSAVEYENGDPDTWAETPVPGDKMTVKDEYDGDHVKRNEVGYGEFRDDTWKHKDSDKWHGPGKYDNAKVSSERKATAAERIARSLLRTSNESLVEEMTLDLMAMPSAALAATMRRMDAVLPGALPEKQRLQRSLACAKLATKTLGDAATEQSVTALGRIYAGLDDLTLRSMLKVVATATASSRIAQEQDEEEQGGHTSQEQDEDEEEQGGHTSEDQEQGEEGQQAQQQDQGQQQETVTQQQETVTQQDQGQQETVTHGGLCPEDAAMLDEILNEQMAPAPAPGAPPGADELQSLFMPAPVAPMPGGAPMMASQAAPMPDVSFDDDEAMSEPVHPSVASAAGLDDLFSDHPEVQAQREIVASQHDQALREGGYSPSAVRTASVGAKKLGRIQAGKPQSVEDQLSVLWQRPQ